MSERLQSRPFAWDDVALLHELVASRWSVDGPHGVRRIGDFWWTLRNTPADDRLRHMRVWSSGDGALAAAAFLDAPGMGDVIVSPEADPLFDDALDWLEAEHRAAGSGDLTIVVLAGDKGRAGALRGRGYTPGESGNVRFWRSLPSVRNPAALPDGFSIRSVSAASDFERRAFVEASSFDSPAITGGVWRSIVERLPGYVPNLDLIAVGPEGTGASACTCFYDATTGYSEFEAVGTAKAYQRMGVGKAVIVEGLRRLHDAGSKHAIVETTIGNDAAIALYTSCGFEEVARDYGWTKRR